MKRLLALVLTLVLSFTLVACSKTPVDDATETEPPTTVESSSATSPTQMQGGMMYNGFTGAYDVNKDHSTRPVAIMVPNDSMVIGKQVEIDKADFYFECETEGAIPRLLTAFASADRIPDTYGPVRSARTPFVATARALGAVYVHAGGSTGADAILNSGVMDRVNALAGGNGSAFWRDKELWNMMNKEHSLVTGDELTALLKKKNFSQERVKDLPFTFGNKTGETAATTVQINTTPSHRATFIYDATTGLYGKNVGKIESCTPHTSLAGNQIKVANVLVMFGEKFAESSQHVGFRAGSGTAYLFSGGTFREVTFTRTDDSLAFTEADGTPAQFAQGKIYMVLAADTLKDKVIMK